MTQLRDFCGCCGGEYEVRICTNGPTDSFREFVKRLHSETSCPHVTCEDSDCGYPELHP